MEYKHIIDIMVMAAESTRLRSTWFQFNYRFSVVSLFGFFIVFPADSRHLLNGKQPMDGGKRGDATENELHI